MFSSIDTLLEAARYLDLLETHGQNLPEQQNAQQQNAQQHSIVSSPVSNSNSSLVGVNNGNSSVIRTSGAGYIPVGSYVQLIQSNTSPAASVTGANVTAIAPNSGNGRINNSNSQPLLATQNRNNVLNSTISGSNIPPNSLTSANNIHIAGTTPITTATASVTAAAAAVINTTSHNVLQNHLPMRHIQLQHQQQQTQIINTPSPLNLHTIAAATPTTTGIPTIVTIDSRNNEEPYVNGHQSSQSQQQVNNNNNNGLSMLVISSASAQQQHRHLQNNYQQQQQITQLPIGTTLTSAITATTTTMTAGHLKPTTIQTITTTTAISPSTIVTGTITPVVTGIIQPNTKHLLSPIQQIQQQHQHIQQQQQRHQHINYTNDHQSIRLVTGQPTIGIPTTINCTTNGAGTTGTITGLVNTTTSASTQLSSLINTLSKSSPLPATTTISSTATTSTPEILLQQQQHQYELISTVAGINPTTIGSNTFTTANHNNNNSANNNINLNINVNNFQHILQQQIKHQIQQQQQQHMQHIKLQNGGRSRTTSLTTQTANGLQQLIITSNGITGVSSVTGNTLATTAASVGSSTGVVSSTGSVSGIVKGVDITSNDDTTSLLGLTNGYNNSGGGDLQQQLQHQQQIPQTATSSGRRRTTSTNSNGAGTREVHNKLEKNRRAHLKECFEQLKKQLPQMPEEKKTSNLSILGAAIRYVTALKRKERDIEREMEDLAKSKIAFQNRIIALKRELSAKWDNIDFTQLIPEQQPQPQLQQEQAMDTENNTTLTEETAPVTGSATHASVLVSGIGSGNQVAATTAGISLMNKAISDLGMTFTSGRNIINNMSTNGISLINISNNNGGRYSGSPSSLANNASLSLSSSSSSLSSTSSSSSSPQIGLTAQTLVVPSTTTITAATIAQLGNTLTTIGTPTPAGTGITASPIGYTLTNLQQNNLKIKSPLSPKGFKVNNLSTIYNNKTAGVSSGPLALTTNNKLGIATSAITTTPSSTTIQHNGLAALNLTNVSGVGTYKQNYQTYQQLLQQQQSQVAINLTTDSFGNNTSMVPGSMKVVVAANNCMYNTVTTSLNANCLMPTIVTTTATGKDVGQHINKDLISGIAATSSTATLTPLRNGLRIPLEMRDATSSTPVTSTPGICNILINNLKDQQSLGKLEILTSAANCSVGPTSTTGTTMSYMVNATSCQPTSVTTSTPNTLIGKIDHHQLQAHLQQQQLDQPPPKVIKLINGNAAILTSMDKDNKLLSSGQLTLSQLNGGLVVSKIPLLASSQNLRVLGPGTNGLTIELGGSHQQHQQQHQLQQQLRNNAINSHLHHQQMQQQHHQFQQQHQHQLQQHMISNKQSSPPPPIPSGAQLHKLLVSGVSSKPTTLSTTSTSGISSGSTIQSNTLTSNEMARLPGGAELNILTTTSTISSNGTTSGTTSTTPTTTTLYRGGINKLVVNTTGPSLMMKGNDTSNFHSSGNLNINSQLQQQLQQQQHQHQHQQHIHQQLTGPRGGGTNSATAVVTPIQTSGVATPNTGCTPGALSQQGQVNNSNNLTSAASAVSGAATVTSSAAAVHNLSHIITSTSQLTAGRKTNNKF